MYTRPGSHTWSYALPVRFRGAERVLPDGEVITAWRGALLYVHLDEYGQPASASLGAMT